MSFDADIFDDTAIFDGLQTVTYRRMTGFAVNDGGRKTETYTDIIVANVLRHGATDHESMLSGAGEILIDSKWQLPQAQMLDNLVPFIPKIGDRIIEANGSIHHVLHFEIVTLLSRFRTYTRRIA